jgi:hypothetical protein
METFTITEAARLAGATRKSIERRVERGTLRSVLRDGKRLIPLAELERAKLIRPPAGVRAAPVSPPVGDAGMPDPPGGGLPELVARLEVLAAENGRLRALTEVAESSRSDLEQELFRLRARVRELETQPGRRRWWGRSRSSQPNQLAA